MQQFIIKAVAVFSAAMIPEFFTVIRGNDKHRIVQPAKKHQALQNSTDGFINTSNLSIAQGYQTWSTQKRYGFLSFPIGMLWLEQHFSRLSTSLAVK